MNEPEGDSDQMSSDEESEVDDTESESEASDRRTSCTQQSKPPSKSRKKKCRLCKQSIIIQNFASHMATVHKTKDLREHGQASIFNYCKKSNMEPKTDPDTIDDEEKTETVVASPNKRQRSDSDLNLNSMEVDQPEIINLSNEDTKLILEKINSLQHEILKLSLKIDGGEQISSCISHPDTLENTSQDIKSKDDIFQNTSNIKDIIKICPEFKFTGNSFVCQVCHKESSQESALTFKEENLSILELNSTGSQEKSPHTREFRNLISKLKRHIALDSHQSGLTEKEEDSKLTTLIQDTNYEIGMRCGRLVYNIVWSHRPYTDYEYLIATSYFNGCEVGELNHSRKFAVKFASYLAAEIENRLHYFLNTVQKQTGFKPPVCIIADKDTLKHRTRQIVILLAVIPDSAELIQTIYIGHPIIKCHTGPDVVASITNVTDKWITPQQFVSGSMDGQYFNLNVPSLLNDHYGLNDNQAHYTWDPVHRAGLQDKAVRKLDVHSSVVDVTSRIGDVFKYFNWGKNYELLADIALAQNCKLQDPLFASETRFANYASRLYTHMENDLGSCIAAFEEVKLCKRDGNSDDRKKAQEAEQLQHSIQNKKFAMHLSGLCDVYKKFGELVTCLQKINILPWERLVVYNKTINHMEKMIANLKEGTHETCPTKCEKENCPEDCSKKCKDPKYHCLWPTLHTRTPFIEKGSWNDPEKEGNLIIINDKDVEKIHQTRLEVLLRKEKANENPIKKAKENILTFYEDLVQKLKTNVFDEDDHKVIKDTETLTDLKSVALEVNSRGPHLIHVYKRDEYISAIRRRVRGLDEIPDEDLKRQHLTLLKVLEDLKIKNDDKRESKDIISCLMSSEKKLYINIELILYAITVAAISFSVETDAKSIISLYNLHNSKLRTSNESTIDNEMMIAKNGPPLGSCDSIVSAALKSYFSKNKKLKNCHFTIAARSKILRKFSTSKVVNRIKSEPAVLPFMV